RLPIGLIPLADAAALILALAGRGIFHCTKVLHGCFWQGRSPLSFGGVGMPSLAIYPLIYLDFIPASLVGTKLVKPKRRRRRCWRRASCHGLNRQRRRPGRNAFERRGRRLSSFTGPVPNRKGTH